MEWYGDNQSKLRSKAKHNRRNNNKIDKDVEKYNKETEALMKAKPFFVPLKIKSHENSRLQNEINNFKYILKDLFTEQDNKYIREKIVNAKRVDLFSMEQDNIYEVQEMISLL